MKVKLMQSKQPKIYINNYAFNKIFEYVNGIDKEIGWLGTVIRDGLNFFIDDVFLFKQEVHSTTTEITPEGLNEFAMELMSEQNGIETWNNMKLWGHSHVNMGTNPSGQDDKQIETFESCGYDFFIRMICNKKGSMRLDLYDYTTGIIYEELNYTIYYSEEDLAFKSSIEEKIKSLQEALNSRLKLSQTEKQDIKLEIKEKVKEKSSFTYSYNGYNKNSNVHNTYSWWDEYDTHGYNSSYYTKSSKKKQEKTEERAKELFDILDKQEIMETYIHLESGGSLEDMYIYATEDFDTMMEIESLIFEYVLNNPEEYAAYLNELEMEEQV